MIVFMATACQAQTITIPTQAHVELARILVVLKIAGTM